MPVASWPTWLRAKFALTGRAARSRLSCRLALEWLEDRVAPATLPADFVEARIIKGITKPTAMELAPDGRMFVTEQTGTLRVISNGALLPTPFLTLPVNSMGERGLLGVTLDPDFANNHFVYIYYTTATEPIHNRVSRFTEQDNVAVPGSEVVLLDIDPLSASVNHNGGAIHFGKDGKLYIGVGENGNAPLAQSLDNPFGKLLRINKDGSIPADNPFVSTTTGVDQAIWAYGLRNPFTFAVQPGTGRIFINDVGGADFEEINDGIAGSNYGWPTTEGATTDPRFRAPLFAYGHGDDNTTGCAITGGVFYNPATNSFPSSFVGKYFFADLCNHWIRVFDPATNSVSDFATDLPALTVDLRVDAAGNLYYLTNTIANANGGVTRIEYTGTLPPAIDQSPGAQTVTEGQPVTFKVSAMGTPPFTYQWQRNGMDIADATASSYTLAAAQLTDDGATFRVVVSNAAGMAASQDAILTVVASQMPTATITAPASGSLYAAGDAISFAGSGTDPEEGNLPASALTWRVDFHHGGLIDSVLRATTGIASGSFTVPASAASIDGWFRIHLSVHDSTGRTSSTFRDVHPLTATVSLATGPAGLQLALDGEPVTPPFTFTSVAGLTRTLAAAAQQTVNGVTYAFVSWSDGGAAAHAITTLGSDTTYTAVYQELINDNVRFISSLFLDVLGRPAETAERTSMQQTLDESRDPILNQVALGVVVSSAARANQIETYYATILKRSARTEEVAYWQEQFQQGATPVQVAAEIEASEESFALYSDNLAWLDAVYRDLLGRERQTGEQGFVEALAQNLATRQQVTALVVGSPEYQDQVIRQTYALYLRRTSRPAEEDFWRTELDQPAAAVVGASAEERFRAGVLASREYFQQHGGNSIPAWVASLHSDVLQASPEVMETQASVIRVLDGYVAARRTTALDLVESVAARTRRVEGYYTTYLGRPASADDVNFIVDALTLGAGVAQLLAGILGSNEYAQQHLQEDPDPDIAWLQAAYQDLLGRSLDGPGRDFWLNQLQQGATRSAIAAALLSSPEYHGRLVAEHFRTYLGRAPTAAEVQFSLEVLRQSATDEELVAVLLASAEYFQ